MRRRSGRDLPPWRMVHGQPVNAGYDTAGDDGAGHASAGHASDDGACGDGAGSGRGAELVRRPSAVPARHRRDGGVARPPVRRRRVVVATVRVVGRAARHEPTRNGARWLLRNGVLYIATGAWVLARRWWEARTNARYERLLRAAEAAGDYERLTDWEQRAEQARERRHRRRLAWITAPLDVARTAAVMTLVGVGFLLLLGGMLAVAHRDPAWLLTPAAEGRGRDRVGGVAAGPGVAAGHGGRAVAAAGAGCGSSAAATARCRAGPPPAGCGSTRR